MDEVGQKSRRLELSKSGLVHMGRNRDSMEHRLSPQLGIRNESLRATRVAFSIETGCEFPYFAYNLW